MNNELTHTGLIYNLHNLGFTRVSGKGIGVLEKLIDKGGSRLRILALVSKRDATLLVQKKGHPDCKFQFKRSYDMASSFIRDYVGGYHGE